MSRVHPEGIQAVDDGLGVGSAARLQHDLHRHDLHRQAAEGALMDDLLDVGVQLAEGALELTGPPEGPGDVEGRQGRNIGDFSLADQVALLNSPPA